MFELLSAISDLIINIDTDGPSTSVTINTNQTDNDLPWQTAANPDQEGGDPAMAKKENSRLLGKLGKLLKGLFINDAVHFFRSLA